MKNPFRLAVFAILLTIIPLAGFSAPGPGAKLFIATDKEQYASAEKIQFQVFLMNPTAGTNHSAFVELLDCRGNRLVKKILPFRFSIAAGEISLPANYADQFCVLYCYILNKDSIQQRCFKRIRIGGGPENTSTQVQMTAFYEGNSFVAESPNNILLRCRDENQHPVVVKGKIVDAQKRVYAVFETNNQGFAKLKINPENKVPYFISFTDPAGKENQLPLRLAQPSGITLNVATGNDSISYQLISYSQPNTPLIDYRVEALMNGQLLYDASISFQNGLSAVSEALARKDFPPGFIVFKVSDNTGRVQAERIIYNDENKTTTSLLTIVDTVNKREVKVVLPPYISGKACINLSGTPVNLPAQNDPFFFENPDPEAISLNDQLIAASDIPGGSGTAEETANRYLSVSGTLLNNEKKPMRNKNVNLVLVQRNLEKKFITAKTDDAGNLRVDNLVFFDSVTVYYQLADKSAEKNDVYMDLVVTPSPNSSTSAVKGINLLCGIPDNAVSNTQPSTISTESKTLEQVVVRSEKEKTDSEKFAEKNVSGQYSSSTNMRNEFDFIKNPVADNNINLFDFIKGRIPSIRVVTTPEGFPVLIGSAGGTVGVYLNDMELDSISMGAISALQVKDVALLRYYSMGFKPKIVWRNMLTDLKAPDAGDILIYTRKDFMTDDRTKGLPKTVIAGYNLEKPAPASPQTTAGTHFWKAGWDVQPAQVIYATLPADKPGAEAVLTIEGINNLLAPYRFTQKIVLN